MRYTLRMRKTVRVFAPAILGAILLTAFFAHADLREEIRPESGEKISGQYIVVFKDSVDADQAENDVFSRTRGERLNSYRNVLSGFSARFSDAEIELVKSDPRVAFVSEDRVVSTADSSRERDISALAHTNRGREEVTANAYYTSASTQKLPTGIDRINAENKANKGAGVEVAVIDTGILATHPDLAGKVVGGKNCTTASGGYTDQNGHGTHVAGTIAAVNNTVGAVGVAPGVKLWSVRVLDRFGNGSWSSVICGLDFVTGKAPANGGPIKIANLSLGGGGVSDNNCGNTNNDALHRAVCRARDAGVTIVVAAGNSGVDAANSVPAGYDDAVITVSALADTDGRAGGLGASNYYGADDTFATFSNWGTVVDIGAPGVSIYSTWLRNGYNTLNGTSMAAPHVAGAAALYIATHPSALWGEVRAGLVGTGEAIGSGHTDPSGNHPEPVLRVDTL